MGAFFKAFLQTSVARRQPAIPLKLKIYGKKYFILYYSRVFPYHLIEWIWHLFFNDKVQIFSSEGNGI